MPKCYCCPETVGVEEHHLIPQSRGGTDFLTEWLCSKCHGQAHKLAISDVNLLAIPNVRLRKIVEVLRLSQELPHSDEWKVVTKFPERLYGLIKLEAKKRKVSIDKCVPIIIAEYFQHKKRLGRI